jgi:hypothetical protein
MNRFKAALIHLGISAAIGLSMLLFMLMVWYPGPFFRAVGADGLVMILLGVDIAIGPLITLAVFKQGKRGLKFDLMVIALLQLSAFLYGVSVIFEARPTYVAFVVDRFELVRAVDIDPADLGTAKLEQFRTLPLLRPQVIGVQRPVGGEEKLKALDLAFQGKDIHVRPEYYVPYETQREEAKRKLQPLKRLKELNPAVAAQIDRDIEATGRTEDQLGFLPLRARERDLSVVLDRSTGEILDYWTYRPWEA